MHVHFCYITAVVYLFLLDLLVVTLAGRVFFDLVVRNVELFISTTSQKSSSYYSSGELMQDKRANNTACNLC